MLVERKAISYRLHSPWAHPSGATVLFQLERPFMPTTLTPQEFVNKWRGSTSTERQAYQQHFIDLCHLVGHPTPAELDPENKFFTFEAGATKQSGGNGFADVWYKDHFAIEYKGPDGNLSKAYNQLLQYRESLENPPLLIVSNCQTISIRTNFTGSPQIGGENKSPFTCR